MRENRYSVNIFDGEYTRVYTTTATSKEIAEAKITNYHKAFGRKVVKVNTIKK